MNEEESTKEDKVGEKKPHSERRTQVHLPISVGGQGGGVIADNRGRR